MTGFLGKGVADFRQRRIGANVREILKILLKILAQAQILSTLLKTLLGSFLVFTVLNISLTCCSCIVRGQVISNEKYVFVFNLFTSKQEKKWFRMNLG